MRRPSLRHVIWVSGIAWIVSWFCLGLEIFYWHHVTTTLHLNLSNVPPGYPKPRPGGFLLSVLAGSALAPAVFLAAAIVTRADKSRKQRRRHTESQGMRSMRTVSMSHISIVVNTRPRPESAGTSPSSRKRS